MKFFFLSSHAHYALDPTVTRVSGGAELQVALLARELALRGHETIVVGGDTGQGDDRVLEGVLTKTGGKFHTGNFGDTVAALPRILHLLRKHRPDYVVVLGWTAWLYILAHLRLFFGYQLVFICGLDTEIDGSFAATHGWKGRLFEMGVVAADIRFAMSEHQRELFRRQNLSCKLYRNLILPRKAPRILKKEVDLLWVGRCQPIKRPHLFLDLVERLPETRCEMICPKEDETLWEDVSTRAQSLRNLVFHERIPYQEVQDRYDRARFLVSTSKAEGFPNVMIQAAQGGAGILSFELDPDGLIQTFSAGYCAGGDFEKLASRVSELVANDEEPEQMVKGSERMLSEWLDNEKNADAFLEGLK